MATESNISSSSSDIIAHSFPSVHNLDSTHVATTTHKLNGQNYLQWSQSILMIIRGKEKEDYLTGDSAAPETTAPTYKKWMAENNMVMSWLVNSMMPDIGENFLSFETAKEIWDAAKETFSDAENTSEVVEIEGILHDLRQGDLTVTQYFNILTRNWRQLDTYEVHKWSCTTDASLYKQIVEKKRVYKFLLGLNKNLDEVRGRLMGVKPSPSLREVFSEVRREESRKKIMMGPSQHLNIAENSALVTLKTQFAPSDNRQKNKGRPWCDYCRKPGHSRDTCWKLHGKPADWKPARHFEKEGRGNHVNTEEESKPEASPFNKEQMEMLQKLISNLQSTPSQTESSSNHVINSGTLAHKGNFLSAFTDLASGKTIGNAEECSGLYILKKSHYPQEQPQKAGENSYQCLDFESFIEPSITTKNHIPLDSPSQHLSADNTEFIVDMWDKEPIQEEMEKGALPQQIHEVEPSPNSSENTGNNISNSDDTIDFELENDILNMPIAWRKGVRSCTQHPIGNFISYDKLSPSFRAFTSNITKILVPHNIHEAFKCPKWKSAVDEEVRALEKNGTWEITKLPRDKKPVGCKWIFTVKYKANGNVDRYKARLVAKGFTQSHGVDYHETFAPVAKLNTIRVLLSLAANLDWKLHQLDVKNAFLNGDLEEEVYMEIPPGLESKYNVNKVCRLKKSLYGLKQSPRAWFERFMKALQRYGYTQCQSDHTLFIKHSSDMKLAIIIVYVDDIILTGDHEEELCKIKQCLAKEFEIKDIGNLKFFLGMEIARSKKGIAVSQRKYVLDLLSETGMLGCKPIETPMDSTVKLDNNDGSAPVDKERYQRLVGKLLYLAHTRPDIGFSVSVNGSEAAAGYSLGGCGELGEPPVGKCRSPIDAVKTFDFDLERRFHQLRIFQLQLGGAKVRPEIKLAPTSEPCKAVVKPQVMYGLDVCLDRVGEGLNAQLNSSAKSSSTLTAVKGSDTYSDVNHRKDSDDYRGMDDLHQMRGDCGGCGSKEVEREQSGRTLVQASVGGCRMSYKEALLHHSKEPSLAQLRQATVNVASRGGLTGAQSKFAGKCSRCLASDHRVTTCRDPFRCFQCLGFGHKGFQCKLRHQGSSPNMLRAHRSRGRAPTHRVVVPFTEDYFAWKELRQNAILADIVQPANLGRSPIQTIAYALAKRFGGYPTDFVVARHREHDYAVFLPEWVSAERLVRRQIITLEGFWMNYFEWGAYRHTTPHTLPFMAWIKLHNLPFECCSIPRVAAIVGGFGRFLRANENSKSQ
uniref:CCHC-type domain-containing protein n=1 Tax=Ananas comosus var. bracteatus TaxID=296719 RepID=A0A6V7PJR3_ANACO|nr:unnamed protein product [Ananas comosus var. bracteatus]